MLHSGIDAASLGEEKVMVDYAPFHFSYLYLRTVLLLFRNKKAPQLGCFFNYYTVVFIVLCGIISKITQNKVVPMYFEEMKLGMTVNTPPAVIKKEKMLAFAKDYDNIPLHTDEEYAKTTPFGKLIAPGVMSFMSVWSKYLEVDLFGSELLAGKSTKIEWLKPVYADDVLTGKATVTDLQKRSVKNGLVEITIDAYNQHGDLVLKDVTEAIVKCRPEPNAV